MEVVTIETHAFTDVMAKLDEILKYTISSNELKKETRQTILNEYITAADAKRILKFGTSWFWNLRKEGIPYSKIGGQVIYRKTDFDKLVEANFI
jgi:hypothetical protein